MSRLPDDPTLPNSSHRSGVACHADPRHHMHNVMTAHSSVTQDEDLSHLPPHSLSPPRDVASPSVYLPTPRTRSPAANVTSYLPVVTRSPESPSMYARSRTEVGSSFPSLVPRIQPTLPSTTESLGQDSGLRQIVTPETSPKTPSGSAVKRPLSAPTLGKVEGKRSRVKSESPPLPLAPAPIIASPRAFRENSRPPVVHAQLPELSSPFTENSQSMPLRFQKDDPPVPVDATSLLPSHATTKNTSLQENGFRKPDLPIALSESAPRASSEGDLQFSLENQSRQPGGELDRIHSRWSEFEQARAADLESRRPEYLKRLRRPDAVAEMPQENGTKGNESLGITETPIKGRRLQLFDFQKTSAESFEESLMTHGYGKYGEPRTPQRPITAADARSQEAMAWLAQHTPSASALNSSAVPTKSDLDQSEREHKKRKRLEVFKSSAARAYSKLYASEVEGMGRVLLNVSPEGLDGAAAKPPPPKKRGRKRKGAAVADKGKAPDRAPKETVTAPRWLDDEYPWCLGEKELKAELDARDVDKLKWIEQYFSRDSDSDEDDMEVERNLDFVSEISDIRSIDEARPDSKKSVGRGKAVPLQRDPPRQKHKRPDRFVESKAEECHPIFFPTDPADARMALLSKRSVRQLVQKKLRKARSHSSLASADGRLNCLCGRAESEDEEVGGRPAVQCDECFDWHHLECIGVRDAAELGSEEDPWYCSRCRPPLATRSPSPVGQRLPTLVPTDEAPVRTDARHDVAFYSSSPLRDWSATDSLRTPNHRRHDHMPFRYSLWDEASVDPRTPVDVRNAARYYNTPKRYDGDGDGDSDLAAKSPGSRGLLGPPRFDPFVTPKRSTTTTTGMGAPFWDPSVQSYATTPRGRLPSAGFGFGYNPDDSVGAMFNPSYTRYPRSHAMMMYGLDDTPISRNTRTGGTAKAKGARDSETPTPEGPPGSQQQQLAVPALPSFGESPLAGRGELGYMTRLHESPVGRSAAAAAQAQAQSMQQRAKENKVGKL